LHVPLWVCLTNKTLFISIAKEREDKSMIGDSYY
jgi:hypothetical protein